jgi:hypothetical protein
MAVGKPPVKVTLWNRYREIFTGRLVPRPESPDLPMAES